MNATGFIQEKLDRIEKQNKRLDQTLTTNTVLLRKRLRDWTAQDAIGVFNSQGVWKTVVAKGIHTLNIIKPMVKTTSSAVLTADVKVTIEPRFVKDTQSEMVADVCNAIKDIKTEEQWTHQLCEQIATEPQIAPGVFIRVKWNPYANKRFHVEEWGEEEIEGGGKSVCKECGYEYDASVQMCEECGGETEQIEEPQKESISQIKDVQVRQSGDTKTVIVPAIEIVMDDRGTQAGNIKAARWMLHRHLEPESEIKLEYPNAPAGNKDWCYPLKWQRALQTGQDFPNEESVDDLAEIKDLYLTPQMYLHLQLDEDFILKDGENVRFYAPKGKTFSDGLFNGNAFEEPPVLCFVVKSGQIIDVYPCDFRDEFIYINFLSNPSSFYGLFLTEMIPLQDVVNYMFTVQVYHTKRNARTTKILNSGAFDPEDVEKDVVLTKDPLPYDAPIGNTFGMIPSATLSDAPMTLISTILATKGDIGGVTPAMQGQAQPNEPYAAQRQQKEQSMGQLTPFLRSIALGKVAWAERQIKEAQKNWSEEDFEFLKRLNDDWSEDHIKAFLEANLDTDIVIGYEQGSEAPRNLFDKEMALRQFMADVMNLAQLNPNLAKPEVSEEILLRIKQFTQVDVDVANTEAEVRLSDARFDKLKHLLDGMQDPGDPMARQIVAMQLLSLPDLTPSMYEDAVTEVEFYRDKITNELAKASPNFLLVTCLESLIKMLKGQKVGEIQEDMALAMEAQQPAMEQQQQMAQEQMMQEQAMREQQMAQEQQMAEQQMAIDQQNRQADMDFEREKMKMGQQDKITDAMIAGIEREHQSELNRKDAKNAK